MRRRVVVYDWDRKKTVKLPYAVPLQKALEIAEGMKKEKFREAIIFLNGQIKIRELELSGFACIKEKKGKLEFREDKESADKSRGHIGHITRLMNEITILKDKKMEIGSGYAFTDAFGI